MTAAAGQPTFTIDASGFSAGVTNLSASGTGDAILYGGSGGGGTLTAAGSGNDVLIGEAADTTLTDTGTGRNILIAGGAGGDTLVGNGNDILVSGTTEYDSNNPANIAALDAILAEWASSDSYAKRIKKIKMGVRRGRRSSPIRCVQQPHHPYRQQRQYSLGQEHSAPPDRQRRQCSRGPEQLRFPIRPIRFRSHKATTGSS